MTLTLTLQAQPDVPLEAEVLTPDRLAAAEDVAALPLWHGNERVRVGDFFAVSGSGDDVRLEGDLRRVHRIGTGMTAGRLTVEGDVGDWAGAEMRGGTLVVRGSAGHHLGGAYPGDRAGMRGGEIVVHGDAGAQAGAGLRRGLIAIGGRAGEAAGLRMLAGTIVARAGSGRARGPACGAARSSRWRRWSRSRRSRSRASTARRSCACICAGCRRSDSTSRSTAVTRAGRRRARAPAG